MAKSAIQEELELNNDPKYKNFANQVDKALKAFECTTEWADLGKLIF